MIGCILQLENLIQKIDRKHKCNPIVSLGIGKMRRMWENFCSMKFFLNFCAFHDSQRAQIYAIAMHHFFTQYNWLRYACTGKLNVLCFLNFFIIIRNALMSHQVLFIISFTFYNFFCDTDQIAQHCVCFFADFQN